MKKLPTNKITSKALAICLCWLLMLLVANPLYAGVDITKTDETVCGADDGTATVSVTNGTAPYTYLWSNGGTGTTITNLAPATYTVTVTDANDCQGTGSVTIDDASSNINLSISGGGIHIRPCDRNPSITLTGLCKWRNTAVHL